MPAARTFRGPFLPAPTAPAVCWTTPTTPVPADFRGLPVPEVLQQGDHVKIRRWRRERQLEKTLRNRPDLLEQARLTKEDRRFLATLATA